MKILIAEDDADSRIYLERILKGSNFAVESAENGLVAWNRAHQSPPDMIISDILMPEMDGFSLCLQWKKDAKLKHIPFVFYTATYTSLTDEQLALNLGAERFVTKPQPPDVLLKIIRDVLSETGGKMSDAVEGPPSSKGVIEQYNAALFRKLEKKVLELEQEADKRKNIEIELINDIAERKRTEELLRDSEARYRAVITQAFEGIVICDPDTGLILESNARFEEQFGYSLSADAPLYLSELIADDSESLQQLLQILAQDVYLPPKRSLFKDIHGLHIPVIRTGTMIQYQGRRMITMTFLNISQEIQREQEILQDAETARRVQTALLSPLKTNTHVEVDTIYHPRLYVGGDLYFLDWRHEGKLLRGFLIDAMGKGLSTALYAAAQHVMLRELNETDLPLAEQVRLLNQRITQHFTEGQTANGIAFEVDLETRELRWVAAGLSKFWIHSKIDPAQSGRVSSSLGIHPDELFETHTLPLSIGDSFYYCTDGLSTMLETQIALPLKQYSDMVDLLRALAISGDCRDDATAVCIRISSFPDSLIRRNGWPKIIRFDGYGDYQRYKGEVAKILEDVTGQPHSLQEVAVHEALANAMECRDGISRPHRARLSVNKIGERLIIRVKSTRMGFAGNSVLQRLRSHPEDLFAFGEDAVMGRGIPMMLSISHFMAYNSNGTELLLAWNLGE